MKKAVLIFLSLLVASCAHGGRGTTERMYISSNPDRERDVWKKVGATELETLKALLECGLEPNGKPGMYISSLDLDGYDYGGPSEKGHVSPVENRYVASLLCMEASGFTSKGDLYNLYCRIYSRTYTGDKAYLAACQPGAVPLARSVERRLNSQYCKFQNRRENPECQPGPDEHKLLAPTPLQRDIWKKEGATEVEVLKALLECGLLPNIMAGRHNNRNEYVTLLMCMEASGFTSTRGSHYFCTNYANNPYNIAVGETYLAACQPGVAPVARSVERRLNGWYCKRQRYANNPECQP